jgi:hypothetical protein
MWNKKNKVLYVDGSGRRRLGGLAYSLIIIGAGSIATSALFLNGIKQEHLLDKNNKNNAPIESNINSSTKAQNLNSGN